MNKEAQYRQHRQDLDRSQRRLSELETRGIEAMSRYDVEIAYGGDAEGAVRMATRLVSNHIAYFSEQLTHCDEPVPQITLFDASRSSEDAPSPQ